MNFFQYHDITNPSGLKYDDSNSPFYIAILWLISYIYIVENNLFWFVGDWFENKLVLIFYARGEQKFVSDTFSFLTFWVCII